MHQVSPPHRRARNINPPSGGQISKINWKLEIGNWKFPRSGAGFTLIEILVSISLLGIIAGIISQIFFLGIRSQGKTEVLREAKQNGDYALSVIEGMVINAVDITASCNDNTKTLTILNQDGLTTTFDCSGTQIASNSSYPEPTPMVTTFLTNEKVSISSCNFRIVCPTPPLSPKYVFVNFTISPQGYSLTPTPGSTVFLEYQTTISLRNYK